jgi:hypothetical protein
VLTPAAMAKDASTEPIPESPAEVAIVATRAPPNTIVHVSSRGPLLRRARDRLPRDPGAARVYVIEPTGVRNGSAIRTHRAVSSSRVTVTFFIDTSFV